MPRRRRPSSARAARRAGTGCGWSAPWPTGGAATSRPPANRCGSSSTSSGHAPNSLDLPTVPLRRTIHRPPRAEAGGVTFLVLGLLPHRGTLAGGVAARSDAEFVEDRRHVPVDGAHGDYEPLRDFSVGHAFGEELEHFGLSRGESGVWGSRTRTWRLTSGFKLPSRTR